MDVVVLQPMNSETLLSGEPVFVQSAGNAKIGIGHPRFQGIEMAI